MRSQFVMKNILASISIFIAGLSFIFLSETPSVIIQYFGNSLLVFDAFTWCVGVALGSLACWLFSPRFARALIIGLVFIYVVGGVGYLSTFIVLLWIFGLTSAGILVLNLCIKNQHLETTSISEAFILGLSLWVAISGILIHTAGNDPWLYLLLCAAPIFILFFEKSRLFSTFFVVRSFVQDAHASVCLIPFWLWSVGIAIIGWVLRWTSFPSVAYDDHAGRLRLFAELQHFQQAQFEVENQIWSVAPFASDLIHATISHMVGSDSRGAVNLVLSILLLTTLARLLRMIKISSSSKLVLIVLMASTPMLGNLLLSRQSELLLAVIALIGLRLAFDARGGIFGRHVLGVIACAALCAAIKLPGAVLGLSLILSLVLRLWDTRAEFFNLSFQMRWPALVFLFLLTFVAFHSYTLAYILTGNPVFPLYNGIFHSPYFPPENFNDQTWIHGFTLWNFVRAFFETSAFFESGNYVGGWQYLFLLPAGIISIWKANDVKIMRAALIPLVGFGMVMFAATQYWRYLFPIMPIATFVMTPLFALRHRALRIAVLSVAILCIFLNLLFYKNISWMMSSPSGVAYHQSGKDIYIERYAPVAALTEHINEIAPGARVLYPSEAPYGAKLLGIPLYLNWYSPIRQSKFRMLSDIRMVSDFLKSEEVDFVILKSVDTIRYSSPSWVSSEIEMSSLNGFQFELPDIRWTKVEPTYVGEAFLSPEDLLRLYMSEFGNVELQVGPFILYSLREDPVPYRSVFDLQFYKQGTLDSRDLFLPLTDEGVVATLQPEILTLLDPEDAHQVRYSVEFECSSETGFFVAQINWDVGSPYYRLVPCIAMMKSFVEAIPIPQSATQGLIYITVRENAAAYVRNLTLELY